MNMKTALTIAGSDCSGGAGIQADIKTMTLHGVYAMSAITALTAQNTTGVYAITPTAPKLLAQQLDCIFTDIRPDAVKIGMVCNADLIHVIAEKLRQYDAQNIVIDPVMISTSGRALLDPEAIDTLRTELFPLATLLTPNIPETEALTGFSVSDHEEMRIAADLLQGAFGCAILCKGGHSTGDPCDLLRTADGVHWFEGARIDNPNTHGTGCTLSSAIASNLARGSDLPTAVEKAKTYLSAALSAGLDLGAGNGPLAHNHALLL